MKQKQAKDQLQANHDKSRNGGTITRREVVSRLGKAAYIAPTITLLSLGPIRAGAQAASCPPPSPGGGGECSVPQGANPRVKSRTKSRVKSGDDGDDGGNG